MLILFIFMYLTSDIFSQISEPDTEEQIYSYIDLSPDTNTTITPIELNIVYLDTIQLFYFNVALDVFNSMGIQINRIDNYLLNDMGIRMNRIDNYLLNDIVIIRINETKSLKISIYQLSEFGKLFNRMSEILSKFDPYGIKIPHPVSPLGFHRAEILNAIKNEKNLSYEQLESIIKEYTDKIMFNAQREENLRNRKK